MSRVTSALSNYHHKFDNVEPPLAGRVAEALPLLAVGGLGVYALFGGPVVTPRIPDDAKQVAIAQPTGRYADPVRAFKVTRRQYDAGVDCGGTDPWLSKPRIEKVKAVQKGAEYVIFKCDDSARLRKEFGKKPVVGELPLHPNNR